MLQKLPIVQAARRWQDQWAGVKQYNLIGAPKHLSLLLQPYNRPMRAVLVKQQQPAVKKDVGYPHCSAQQFVVVRLANNCHEPHRTVVNHYAVRHRYVALRSISNAAQELQELSSIFVIDQLDHEIGIMWGNWLKLFGRFGCPVDWWRLYSRISRVCLKYVIAWFIANYWSYSIILVMLLAQL